METYSYIGARWPTATAYNCKYTSTNTTFTTDHGHGSPPSSDLQARPPLTRSPLLLELPCDLMPCRRAACPSPSHQRRALALATLLHLHYITPKAK
jgi:hypothetical protein